MHTIYYGKIHSYLSSVRGLAIYISKIMKLAILIYDRKKLLSDFEPIALCFVLNTSVVLKDIFILTIFRMSCSKRKEIGSHNVKVCMGFSWGFHFLKIFFKALMKSLIHQKPTLRRKISHSPCFLGCFFMFKLCLFHMVYSMGLRRLWQS